MEHTRARLDVQRGLLRQCASCPITHTNNLPEDVRIAPVDIATIMPSYSCCNLRAQKSGDVKCTTINKIIEILIQFK